MEDKSKLTAIILAIITIIVVISTFIFGNINGKNEKNDINIVTNYSNFYTVNSCLYRVITYIESNDKDALIKVLDSKYKKNNNITLDNVIDSFKGINSNSNFVSKKMYYETINKNITKYYVYGIVETNEFTNDYINNIDKKDAYYIVYLDTTNKTFSIEPYSGEIFKGGENNG